ncbi:hypothetical protein [Chryseobacterium sp.]|uniref:hypothetical protein n=1 Tax=Chryseobacterium sp. TaxID=1871047 RepID=UPI002898C862|nr:hypothetical protein [Chryseobacterium sp.]
MEMRLNNIINIVIFLCLLISCKNEAQKKEFIKNEVDKKEVFSEKKSENTMQTEDDSWKGTYHFEASNRDGVKTIFDITINSLEDILVNVSEEGVKNKYPNIKAKKVDNDKIKISYNPSSDDMGLIFIERSDNEYYISGNPIYFINPGNNEMSLQKTNNKPF